MACAGAPTSPSVAAQQSAARSAPQGDSAPPLVKQIDNGNWLSQSEAAIHVYMTMLPALNVIGMGRDLFHELLDLKETGPLVVAAPPNVREQVRPCREVVGPLDSNQ